MKCFNKECEFYGKNELDNCTMIFEGRLEFCKHYIPEPEKKDLQEMLDRSFITDNLKAVYMSKKELQILLQAIIDKVDSK